MRALGLLIALAVPVTAQAEVVERVVATVNEDAIFLSDLRTRAAPFLERVAQAPTESERLQLLKSLYDQMLTLMIDEMLIKSAAARSKIRVTEDDLSRAIGNVRAQNNMTEAQFWEAVKSQGLTEAQYRADLRKQLLRLKVMNERVRSRVNISEDDVRRRYEDDARQSGKSLKFNVSHVVLGVPEGASATELADARKKATEIRKGLTAETFDKAIEQHGGGQLGWLSEGDLADNVQSELLSLKPGQISKPIATSSGVHLFLLHERETGADLPPFEEQQVVLRRQMLDEAMQKQEGIYLKELRDKAVIKRML